jgi:hypothetical protein
MRPNSRACFVRDVRVSRMRASRASRARAASTSRTTAHALCLAALRWHGFRSSNRYIVFQVLPHTLGLGPEVWRVLSKCHDIRNAGEYEGDLQIDERIVADLLTACSAVLTKLEALKPPN